MSIDNVFVDQYVLCVLLNKKDALDFITLTATLNLSEYLPVYFIYYLDAHAFPTHGHMDGQTQ